MFDFQQLIADLREDKLLPNSLSENLKSADLLKLSGDTIKEFQDKKFYPTELEAPLGCQLELTHSCNLRCIHCYNCSGEKRQELSFKKWMDVARQLVKMNLFECVISGGEPLLLGDKLFKIMSVLHDSGVKFIFITNGMLVNERTVDKLSRYDYYWIQVSIDGSRPSIHDKIRSVKGSWKNAIKAAVMFSQIKLPLTIAHVLVKDNVDFLEEMIETSYLLGALRMVVGKFVYSGRAITNRKRLDLSKKDVLKAYKLLEVKRQEYKEKMDIATPMDPVLYLRYRVIEPCNVILIRPNGDVKLDCVLPFKVGNVMEESIQSIWDNVGKNAWINPKILKYIESIKEQNDILKVFPRPYNDNDVLVR